MKNDGETTNEELVNGNTYDKYDQGRIFEAGRITGWTRMFIDDGSHPAITIVLSLYKISGRSKDSSGRLVNIGTNVRDP